jgi:putative transposase
MKNRDYKEFAPGEVYHVYNRGNGKQDIFLDNSDYTFFIARLKEYLFLKPYESIPSANRKYTYVREPIPEGSFTMLCYCLMPNHFHFVVKQNGDIPVSKLISKLCTGYSIYINKKYEHTGGVFQGCFKSVNVKGDEYLSWLSAYIHQNPKVGDLVKDLEDYEWSSYLDYVGLRNDELCDKSLILGIFDDNKKEYKKFVSSSYDIIKGKKLMKVDLNIKIGDIMLD